MLRTLLGSRNERLLRRYRATVRTINALEPRVQVLSDADLKQQTVLFRERLNRGETLDQLLPEAFAVVREAGQRVLGTRHFDVQLIGGMVLHEGKIAEMRTGEGKTLTATLPAYLNALTGQGVHVITVNDYLAQRDAARMGQLFGFLGLSTACNVVGLDPASKRQAFAADITYGTNNEFGFDYLRDNMVVQPEDRVTRGLHYAVIDEVDSILIDEARTPLIISGPSEDDTALFARVDAIVPALVAGEALGQHGENETGDYVIDLKTRQVQLTEAGHNRAEGLLVQAGLMQAGGSLYDPANVLLLYHVNAALRAHTLFHRDQHYVVQGDDVIIVDEFTGRMMTGRRWSDGLHQAVEAKERVSVQPENHTLASVTFQNYFRLYGRLSGMTGTADTEAHELMSTYTLETVVIPTHRPMVRQDQLDQIYLNEADKHRAILADVQACHDRGQPVLMGTSSIENNDLFARLLEQAGLPFQVLNARHHAQEATVVAQAGRPGAITIATNMAGRGTDIVLGGNLDTTLAQLALDPAFQMLDPVLQAQWVQETKDLWSVDHAAVVAAGGLHVIGTERHESRRIDNQLRGRAGRQGDPGSSRFYLALTDPLMKVFAGDRVSGMLRRLQPQGQAAIEHPMVSRSLESAQRQIEGRNYEVRKQLLDYDDVANEQRLRVYAQRNELVDGDDVSATVRELIADAIEELVREHVPERSIEEQWNVPALVRSLAEEAGLDLPMAAWADEARGDEDLVARVQAAALAAYDGKLEWLDATLLRSIERQVLLLSLDQHWRDHLAALDTLRQGIHLRGYAQKDPKREYKREAFSLFQMLWRMVRTDAARSLLRLRPAPAGPAPEPTPLATGTVVMEALDDPQVLDRLFQAPPIDLP